MSTTPRLRPATFSDSEAIARLNRRNLMDEMDPASRETRWSTYPWETEFEDMPIGWVLTDAAGEVVGNLDNIHLLYQVNGRKVRGAIAAGWAVDAGHRSDSMQLMTTFFRQKNAEVRLAVSASPTASRVFTAMRIPRLPLPWYGSPCFWATNPVAFTRAALRRRAIPGADGLAWPAGFGLLARDAFVGSGRGRITLQVEEVSGFDSRFDGLWPRLAAGHARLRAVRDSRVLEWRYGSELRSGQGKVLAALKGGDLQGYIVLLRRQGDGLTLYDVSDLQAAGDSPAIFRDLLLHAIRIAREEGIGGVKFCAGSPEKHQASMSLRPHSYELPFWQQYYRADAGELGDLLSSASGWDFSLFETY